MTLSGQITCTVPPQPARQSLSEPARRTSRLSLEHRVAKTKGVVPARRHWEIVSKSSSGSSPGTTTSCVSTLLHSDHFSTNKVECAVVD